MQSRLSRIFLLVLLLCLGVILAPVSAQTLPLPAVGQTQKVYVSPSILRAMQGLEKDQALNTRVIVSFETRGGYRSGALSVDDVSTARNSVLAAMPAGSYEVVSTFKRVPAVSLKINYQALEALRRTPGVYAINADREVSTTMADANALTGVGALHTAGLTGVGARVAIIDTGVDSAGGVVHSALADDLLGQACFRTENDCIGGAGSAEDQDGHGTHVAGIITGPEGVAPDAEFYALKVFTTGNTSDTNILNAIDYVIDLNIATPGSVNLINMSLGGDNYSDQASCDADGAAYLSTLSTLNAQGVTVFVATGNDASITSVSSPGCLTGAVGVGSVSDGEFTAVFSVCTENGQADKVTCFSNGTPVQGDGELVDLMAPGCSIVSTGLDESTDFEICGTSMATPYAAGVAGLLIEYLNDNAMSMTPAQIEAHMEATGVQVSDYRMDGSAPTFPRVNPPAMIGSLALDAPANFTITGTTTTSVSSSWDSVAAATEYRVYASQNGGTAVLVGTVTAPTTTFTDNSALCGSLVYFVRSFDGTYESIDSNTDDATVRPCPLTPSGLQASPVDNDTVNLAWTDHNADETSNILQRRVNNGAYTDYQTFAPGTVITYTDDALACGLYQYRAVSERNGDRSAPSNVVQFAACAPDNDNFANPQVITPNVAFTDTEPNQSYGSEEVGDPNYSCKFGGSGPGFQGVWYSITPTVNTRVTVSTAATTLIAPAAGVADTLVGIYTGSHGSLTEVACNDDISTGNFRSTVSSNVNAGTTYYVFVSQWVPVPAGTVGNLVVAFTWSAPIVIPDNDLVANARVMSIPDGVPYTNTVTSAQNATVSGTDLPHSCAWGGPRVGTSTLWWTFTPASNGKIDIDTLASTGSFTDTTMTVYTGTSGSFTQVACNDDEESAGVSLRSEILDLAVTGGTTYTVYVSRWSSTPTATAGTVVLNALFTADPIPAGVTVAPTTVDVSEGGTTDTYTVVLDTAPTSDVTITVTGDADCSVSPTSLTFTNANATTAQTVTVSAIDDTDVEDAHTCTITHTATSSDAAYNGITVASVTGNVTDNDVAGTPGVTVAPTTVDVTEGGATATYTVVLDTAPTSDVTITVTGDADCSVSPTSLTFTNANATTAQTVTVTAVDDTDVEDAHTCTITHTAASSDAAYNGITVASVTGNVTDDEVASVSTELLTNGGFETAGSTNGIPSGWTVQKPSGDKRVCPANNPGNVHGGSCSFKFTGSATDVSKLVQVVDLTGHTFSTGDTLTTSMFVKGNHTTAKMKVVLFVTYTGNPTPVKTPLVIRRNIGFNQHHLPTYTLTSGAVSQIRLVINHQSHGGTIFIDNASLIHTVPAVISRGGVLGLPAAPEGFRK